MTTYQLLKKAIKKEDLAEFKRLSVHADEETLLMTDKNGNNLAHLAVMYNQKGILQEIIRIAQDSDFSILNHTNDNAFTPLECCYLYSAPELIQLLQGKSSLSSSGSVVITQQYERLSKLPPSGFRREGLGKIILLVSALNDIKALEILLSITNDQEKLLHYQTKEGWSGLHFAAYNDQIEVIKFFLHRDSFGQEKARDNDRNSPLIIASGRGNSDIVAYLIEKGWNVNQKNGQLENSALSAAQHGQLNTLILLDEKGAELLAVNKKGENAAMLAAIHGHEAVFIFLMKQGVPVDIKDQQGKTVFHRALEHSHLNIADLLVGYATAEEKNDALLAAIERRDLVVVKWLVEHGASLSVVNKSKMTPMLLAVNDGSMELIDFFLSLKDPPVHDRDNEGDNALFVAIKNRNLPVVKRLLKSGYFSLEDKNGKVQTPLLVAAEVNSADLVAFFHHKGGALESQDEEGNTALHLLLIKGYWGTAIEYLLEQCPALLMKKNNKGETPLHTAIIYKQNDKVEQFIHFISSLRKKEEFLEAKDKQGNTPLLTAVISQNIETIPKLLSAGADILAKNEKNDSVITLTYLNTFPAEIQNQFFSAYQIDYKEYLARRNLYFIFGGEKLNSVLKFPEANVKFGSGLLDEGVQRLNHYLQEFLQEKRPELSPQFQLLVETMYKVSSDKKPEELLRQVETDGIAFQATGFIGHGILATLRNMPGGSMKLSLAERGARVGNAPLLDTDSKKFASVRSILIPAEKRMEIIEMIHRAKNESQAIAVDLLFTKIPELVGNPYQFSSIYQKKFMDICFYSNPKTGFYEQFIDILGADQGKIFYKEFELFIREKELIKYEEFWQKGHPQNSLLDNPIIRAARDLIEKRQAGLVNEAREDSNFRKE